MSFRDKLTRFRFNTRLRLDAPIGAMRPSGAQKSKSLGRMHAQRHTRSRVSSIYVGTAPGQLNINPKAQRLARKGHAPGRVAMRSCGLYCLTVCMFGRISVERSPFSCSRCSRGLNFCPTVRICRAFSVERSRFRAPCARASAAGIF